MDQLTTIDKHIKTMADKCQSLQEKILNSHNLTADDLLALLKEQEQNQSVYHWLVNIKADKFPEVARILPSNGFHKLKNN